MITVRDLIAINKKLINRYQKAIKQIDNGTYQYDGSMPRECIKPMYISKIITHTEGNEYLRRFAPEHVLTDDELYKHRAIINGTPNL